MWASVPALNWFTETRAAAQLAAAPEGCEQPVSLDGGVAAEPTFGPTMCNSPSRVQVEGYKRPSICELPQGSAPGKYEPYPIQTTSPE